MTKLAAVIMAKNEGKYIHVTIESVKNDVDGIVLYDTGSEDDTVSIVRNFARNANLSFHLLEGLFEDFSTSRNKLLDFANTLDYDFLLLLDCNDELKVTQPLKIYVQTLDSSIDAFLVQQQWFIGSETLHYFNVRLIRPNKGFKFEGVVHEYLNSGGNPVGKTDNNVISIYQDRTVNDDKSYKRWEKDLILLEKEFNHDGMNSRTQYYLAQTYDCLNMAHHARNMYIIRAENPTGFQEERFMSMLKIAELQPLDRREQIKWYFSAYLLDRRAEPLVALSKIFREEKDFHLSYSMSKIACDLEYPDRVFLVNKKCYDHDRWQEMSISAFYVGKLDDGRSACLKALESGFDRELNEQNLKFYK